MADEPISTLRVCKHCRIEKPLTEFVRQKGYWMHKCTSCKKAHRRVQYHNREGEYANLDTEAERAKRRESGRQARGRYVWDESWLKKRLIKTCTKCKIELPANPAWFRADTKNTTGLSSWCRSCENRIYWENRASRLEYTRARYRRMAEEEVETLRNWRRRWSEANPEKQKASEMRWKEENRKINQKRRIKRQAKHRTRTVSAVHEFTERDNDANSEAQRQDRKNGKRVTEKG